MMKSEVKDYKSITTKLAIQLAAPHTWAASICPALFGIIYCWQQKLPLSISKGIFLFLACILLQSAVNTMNDYFDFVKGTDSDADHVEVSDAVLIYGHIRPKSALILGCMYLTGGIVCGLIGCIGSGAVPIVIGAIGATVIVLYSGGPLPVSYLPIGEAVSGGVMGGLIPLGIAACADGKVHWSILIFCIPMMISIGLIMMHNNGCDIEKDNKAGRHTLPVYLGRKKTLFLARTLMVIWVLLIIVLPVTLMGVVGLVSCVIFIVSGVKIVVKQLQFRLEPENRIQQMKGIATGNLLVNAAYIAAFAADVVLEVVHGGLF